jgi:hypothetical protein
MNSAQRNLPSLCGLYYGFWFTTGAEGTRARD